MWRTASYNLVKRAAAAVGSTTTSRRYCGSRKFLSLSCCRSLSSSSVGGGGGGGGESGNEISYGEARKLMRLVNVEALKKKLEIENREVIGYGELLEACESMGVARSPDEAAAFAKSLDDAGVVLLFRDKVYLHPDKVADLVRKAVPLALLPDDDAHNDELNALQTKMDEIDVQAHKQVRRVLWTGLGLSVIQVGLFFRLTFWEFSWNVMEPIAFFTTSTGIVIGYAYFLITSRDPTYQDFLKRLFLSRQRKLIKKYNFDIKRFVELQKKCRAPPSSPARVTEQIGIDMAPDEMLHAHGH